MKLARQLLYGLYPNSTDTYFIALYHPNGIPVLKETGIPIERVAELLGEEAAKNIRDDRGRRRPDILPNYREIVFEGLTSEEIVRAAESEVRRLARIDRVEAVKAALTESGWEGDQLPGLSTMTTHLNDVFYEMRAIYDDGLVLGWDVRYVAGYGDLAQAGNVCVVHDDPLLSADEIKDLITDQILLKDIQAPKPANIFGYYIDLDERGDFYADVRDQAGKTIYEIRIDGGDDDAGSNLFEDGFMSNKNDIAGLERHLRDMGSIPADGRVLASASFENEIALATPKKSAAPSM